MEEWKKIGDTMYMISDCGNIKNFKTEKVLSQHEKNGYKVVGIRVDGKSRNEHIHRLVAKAFVPNVDNKTTVNHKDGNKFNNKASNLEWMTQQENVKHAFINNLTKVKVCPIVQMDMHGKEIARFLSIKEIEEKLFFERASIIRACKGRQKTSYGFTWKYVNEVDKKDIKEDSFKGQHFDDYKNYLVSKKGEVYSKKTKKILKPVINKNEHCYVTYSDGKKGKKNFYIHVLVAKLYLPNPNNYSTVIHINKNKSDNRLENLKWVKFYNERAS